MRIALFPVRNVVAAMVGLVFMRTSLRIAALVVFATSVGAAPPTLISHYFDSPRVQDRIWLDVTLPASYATEPERAYPVIYLTDGYWRRTVHADIRDLADTGKIAELIIVGVGYPNHSDFHAKRQRDFLKAPQTFLDCLQHEVAPFIERTYRADPAHRTLWGSSFGGSFLLFAFSEHRRRGALFETYLCSSPVLNPPIGAADVHRRLRKLLAETPSPRANFYLAVGGDETDQFIGDYWTVARLAERHSGGLLRVVHEIIPRATHGGVAQPALLRGLQAFPALRVGRTATLP